MSSPYFLANRLDCLQIAFGFMVSLGESVSNPAATIVISKMFNAIEDISRGEMQPRVFLAHTQSYTYCLLAVTGFSALVNCLGYVLWVGVGYKMGHTARKLMYKALIQQEVSIYEQNNNLSGLAVMYFKDIQDIETATGITSHEIIAMAVGCMVEIGVAFYFSWSVTLICLAGMPLIAIIGTVFSNPISKRVSASKAILDEISMRVTWVLSALMTVKVFQKEGYELNTLHKKLLLLRQSNNRYWLFFSIQQGLCRGIMLMIFVQGFYFGSYMVRKHGLKAGDVVAVFWCCLNASAQLQTLMGHLIEWNKGKTSAERLKKVFLVDADEELRNSIGIMPTSKDTELDKYERLGWKFHDADSGRFSGGSSENSSSDSGTFKNADYSSPLKDSVQTISLMSTPKIYCPREGLCFTDVVFSYPQRNELILSGLNMEFERGSTTFVVGQSGSGKSTLGAVLSKQYPWQAGEVTIDGHELHLLSKNWIEQNVYICEQNPKMFDITIRENIAIGSKSHKEISENQIRQAIEDSCATFIYDLPDQLDSTGVDKLSGGERQRISLARARLCDSPIMLFDEVTSALDLQLQSKIFSKIIKYREGKTNIIITHDFSVIPEGYVVYTMENGLAERYSTISEVFSQKRFQNWASSETKRSKIAAVHERTEHSPVLRSRKDNTSLSSNTLAPSAKSAKNFKDASINLKLFRSVPRKCLLLFGLCLTAVHSAINPTFSFCFSKLIMSILDPSEVNTTLWAMLVLMCALLDGTIVVSCVVLNFSAEDWLLTIREKLFEKLVNTPCGSLGAEESSYYTKLLMSDCEKCSDIITRYWPGVLSMTVLGSTGFICSLAFGWRLTLACFSLFPVFVILNICYKFITTHWFTVRESLRSDVIRLMIDMTSESGFRTLKVQHLEKYFKHIYFAREKQLDGLRFRMVCQIGVGYGILRCFPYALESLLLWYGMRLIGTGEYSIQRTMTVFSMMMFTVITLDQLTSSIGSIGSGFEALERLFEDSKSKAFYDPLERKRPSKTLGDNRVPAWKELVFYRVGKTYSDGTKTLGDFTEKFVSGEAVAIVGPSGVGKSTIARMLLGLESPSTGEIVVDQIWDLSRMSLFDIRQNIGLAAQAPLDFFDGSIEDNLLYGLDSADISGPTKMVEACKEVGAHDFISNMTDQYDTRMKEGLLSGGQLQRLGIARALLRKPKILVLDECTSALDIESKGIVKNMICRLKERRDMIIVIITHQMDVAEIADRIVRLS